MANYNMFDEIPVTASIEEVYHPLKMMRACAEMITAYADRIAERQAKMENKPAQYERVRTSMQSYAAMTPDMDTDALGERNIFAAIPKSVIRIMDAFAPMKQITHPLMAQMYFARLVEWNDNHFGTGNDKAGATRRVMADIMQARDYRGGGFSLGQEQAALFLSPEVVQPFKPQPRRINYATATATAG